ncbi:6-bladed beta-propeller [Gemmatimonadota bacterium]
MPSGLLLFALSLLQACEGGAPAWQGSITDSAGISVVHNPSTPLWGEGEGWTFSEDLRYGVSTGQAEYQFGTLSGMYVDGSGHVYVVDQMAREIRVFDAQGDYLRTIGGPGSGPGEFGPDPAFVFPDGKGGVVATDPGNGRVNRYSADGTPAGSFSLDPRRGYPVRWAMDDSGRLMAQLQGLNVEGVSPLAEGDPIVVYDTTGAVVDTVVFLPKGQTLTVTDDGRLVVRYFGPEAVWVLGANGSLHYGVSDRFKIFSTDPVGRLTRILTRAVEPKPAGEALKQGVRAFLRREGNKGGAPPDLIERMSADNRFPEHLPVIGRLLAGPDETIWVQRIQTTAEMAEEAEFINPRNQSLGGPEWEVFDKEGRYLGVVTLPDRYSPRRISGNHIYGVWRDELDVQYILRFRIEKHPQ